MSRKNFVVGLTGGIGSGKTAVSDIFAGLGIDVIDADIIARDVVKPGTPALASIVEKFGRNILNAEGSLDRAELRAKVFQDSDAKVWLNQLLHPAIREAMQQAIAESKTPYCILSVPLLIENKLQHLVDRILVVDCDETLQLQRALARDGSSEATIKSIMASQASRTTRLSHADDVVVNESSLAALSEQVNTLHEAYLAMAQTRSQ